MRTPPPPPPPLRGAGAAATKSAALLSVSVAPPPTRWSDVVLDRPGAGEVSYELAELLYPMRSLTPAAVAQPVAQVSALALVTSATLPALADIAIVPVASGVGSDAPTEPPEASLTR